MESMEDRIQINGGHLFDGTRYLFSIKFMAAPTNDEIIVWCIEQEFSLSINGKHII